MDVAQRDVGDVEVPIGCEGHPFGALHVVPVVLAIERDEGAADLCARHRVISKHLSRAAGGHE